MSKSYKKCSLGPLRLKGFGIPVRPLSSDTYICRYIRYKYIYPKILLYKVLKYLKSRERA